jgi:hypothetical protein
MLSTLLLIKFEEICNFWSMLRVNMLGTNVLALKRIKRILVMPAVLVKAEVPDKQGFCE